MPDDSSALKTAQEATEVLRERLNTLTERVAAIPKEQPTVKRYSVR